MSQSEPHETPPQGEIGRPAFSAVPKPDPQPTPEAEPEPRRRAGWIDGLESVAGWLILLVLAAVGGALITVYWPWPTVTSVDESTMADRISMLERQVGQLAAGKAPEAAASSFGTLERRLSDLKMRLDADEARLSAAEKGETSGEASGITALKAAVSKNSGDIAQLMRETDRLATIGATPGKLGAATPQVLQALSAAERAIADDQRGLAALRGQLDALSKTNSAALAQVQTHLTDLDKTTPQLKQQLDAAGQRLALLEKTAPPADLAQRLDSFALKSGEAQLTARVDRIEKEDVPGMMRKAAAMLALADLIRASGYDAPYTDELTALRALVPAWPSLTLLDRHAATGAPTVPQLAARFHAEADRIVAAERRAHARNWAEKTWTDIYDLVAVREVGNPPGNTTQERVARAEFALDRGDLPAAIHEVEGLDRPARAQAQVWLQAARARRDIDGADRRLTQHIVAAMAEREGEAIQSPSGRPPKP